jgi:hypothetical protein
MVEGVLLMGISVVKFIELAEWNLIVFVGYQNW